MSEKSKYATLFEFEWVDFFSRLYYKSDDADIFARAAQTAFYFSFSLFPLLFFLISLFGVVLGSAEQLKAEIYIYLSQIMPWSAFSLVRDTVEEIIAKSSSGKITIGLAITLWSASAGIDGIRNALNAVYDLKERRIYWKTKLASLGLTLAVTVLSGIALLIVFYGWQLVGWLSAKAGVPVTSPLALFSLQWLSILVVMLLACEIIYNLLPDFRHRRWVWITPGSVVAIVLWLILSSGFRMYISYFNSYDRAYGSLGAVIILMFWLYLIALVLMAGGAINSVLAEMNIGEEADDDEA